MPATPARATATQRIGLVLRATGGGIAPGGAPGAPADVEALAGVPH